MKLVYFCFISYPFWFFLDNFMQILITCFIEINFQIGKFQRWDLKISTPYLMSIIFGGIFILI